jgi:superfamily II DNA or RNA helicase
MSGLRSNRQLKIHVATTYFKFQCNRRAVLPCGYSIRQFVQSNLREVDWDFRAHRYILSADYSIYEVKSGSVVMPRYFLSKFIKFLENNHISYKLSQKKPVPPRPIELKMNKKFELREEQAPLAKFLTDPDQQFKPLSSQTGSGKTVVTEYAITKLGVATIIILGGLIDQWYKSILEFIDIDKADIYVIKGFESLDTLWKMFRNGYKPKIILWSTRTLALYAVNQSYSSLPDYESFLEEFGIGLAIVDECHLNFNTNVLIDLKTNIKYRIYLSATYQRSNPQGRRIFDTVFPKKLRFGEQFLKKYTEVTVLSYHLGILPQDLPKFKVAKGYLHALYERYLRKKKSVFRSFVSNVMDPIIRTYYLDKKKDGQKLLILCKTKLFAIQLHDGLHYLFPNMKTTVYFSGDKEYGGLAKLDAEVIVSTQSSAGTGTDIKKLKTCINTVSFASAPLAAQSLGRLREIPGEPTYYIDIYNPEITQHSYHVEARINIYKERAAKYHISTLC